MYQDMTVIVAFFGQVNQAVLHSQTVNVRLRLSANTNQSNNWGQKEKVHRRWEGRPKLTFEKDCCEHIYQCSFLSTTSCFCIVCASLIPSDSCSCFFFVFESISYPQLWHIVGHAASPLGQDEPQHHPCNSFWWLADSPLVLQTKESALMQPSNLLSYFNFALSFPSQLWREENTVRLSGRVTRHHHPWHALKHAPSHECIRLCMDHMGSDRPKPISESLEKMWEMSTVCKYRGV